LKRPPAKYPEYRIDALLKRKAEEGVLIYIVVYKVIELVDNVVFKILTKINFGSLYRK
jgi:hypothetical protein